jgi:hypothetical protein
MIRKEYINTLNLLEKSSPINFYDNKQLNDMAKKSRLKNKWNTCDSWNLFRPNNNKIYSILNTDDSSKSGTHWVALVQNGNTLYVYDSFGRTKEYLMKQFNDWMNRNNYKVIFVNKKGEQNGKQLNCGLRCLLWLIFVDKYGLTKCKNI